MLRLCNCKTVRVLGRDAIPLPEESSEKEVDFFRLCKSHDTPESEYIYLQKCKVSPKSQLVVSIGKKRLTITAGKNCYIRLIGISSASVEAYLKGDIVLEGNWGLS